MILKLELFKALLKMQ